MNKLTLLLLLISGNSIAQPNGSLSIDVFMCLGDASQSITFTGSNGTPPYTFSYSINGGATQNITTSSGNSVSVLVPTNIADIFNYQLNMVTDNLGISQNVLDNAFATVYALPIVNAGVDQSVCPGTSVTLSGSGAATYSWNNSVFNGVSFVPISTMIYTVTGTDLNGCINTDQVTVFVECANLLEEEIVEILLWPNPSESIVNFQSDTPIETIEITDVNGKFMNRCTINSSSSSLDMSSLKKGVYFMKLNALGGSVVKRIIIQ